MIYIYILKDPLTKEIRYIGKTNNPDIRIRNHLGQRNTDDSYKNKWTKKMSF